MHLVMSVCEPVCLCCLHSRILPRNFILRIFRIPRSTSYIKVTGSRSRSQKRKGHTSVSKYTICGWSTFDWKAVLLIHISLPATVNLNDNKSSNSHHWQRSFQQRRVHCSVHWRSRRRHSPGHQRCWTTRSQCGRLLASDSAVRCHYAKVLSTHQGHQMHDIHCISRHKTKKNRRRQLIPSIAHWLSRWGLLDPMKLAYETRCWKTGY